MATQAAEKKAPPNGEVTELPEAQALAAALESEDAIAAEAAAIREDATELDAALFLKLWPLLRRPIPSAFIRDVPRTDGKPYDSTGIRSVQVQVDRMNNVLSPMWWSDDVGYEEKGTLAHVTVTVWGSRDSEGLRTVLARTSSWGGVPRGSGLGNIYKGSYTNAAKLAFARLGVGHEVYVGAADLDPDTSEDAAKQLPAGERSSAELSAERIAELALARGAADVDDATLKMLLVDIGVRDTGDGAKVPMRVMKALTPGEAAQLELKLSEIAKQKTAES